MKHPMAKYYTMTRAQKDAAGYPCGRDDGDTNATDNGGNFSNCVSAWRILAHGGGNLMEALANNPSAFIEMQVCSRSSNYSQCGIIQGGGWMFYGRFQSPFYNQVFERSGGTFDIGGMTMTFKSDAEDLAAIGSPNTVFQGWGGEPYWFMFRKDPEDPEWYRQPGRGNTLAGDQNFIECNALNALRHNGYTTFVGKSKVDTNNYTINIEKLVQPLGFQPLESDDSSHHNPTIPAARVKPSVNHQVNQDRDTQIFDALSELTGGGLNSDTTRFVDGWGNHSVEWILKAVGIAREKGARSVRYVDSILIGWEANGYPKSREQQMQERKGKQPAAKPTNFDANMQHVQNWLKQQGDANV